MCPKPHVLYQRPFAAPLPRARREPHMPSVPYTLCRSAQDLMERAVTLGMGAGQQASSPALSSLLAQYASLLAAQVSALCELL